MDHTLLLVEKYGDSDARKYVTQSFRQIPDIYLHRKSLTTVGKVNFVHTQNFQSFCWTDRLRKFQGVLQRTLENIAV